MIFLIARQTWRERRLLGLAEEVYYWMVGVVDALLLLPLLLGVGLGLQLLLDEVVLGELEGDGLVLVERIFIKSKTLNIIEAGQVLQSNCEVNANQDIFPHLLSELDNSTKISV